MPGENNYDANTQTPGREFYEFLSTNDLLKECPKFDPETEWEIREQVNVQTNFAWRMSSLFNDPDSTKLSQQMDMDMPIPQMQLCFPISINASELPQGTRFSCDLTLFTDQINRKSAKCLDWETRFQMHKAFRKEAKIIPFALLVNSVLLQYESLKRCLLFALDIEKLGLKSSRTTYGTIINKLQRHGMKPHLVHHMDNELRNIIAHVNWYVKEDKFVYLVKEETRAMSYKKLESRTSIFHKFANDFFALYWRDYLRPEDMDFASIKKIEEGP